MMISSEKFLEVECKILSFLKNHIVELPSRDYVLIWTSINSASDLFCNPLSLSLSLSLSHTHTHTHTSQDSKLESLNGTKKLPKIFTKTTWENFLQNYPP